MTDEQWRAGADLKLHGARRMTILAWEALKQSKGSVVFMSGSAALDPKPVQAIQCEFRRCGIETDAGSAESLGPQPAGKAQL